MLQQPSVSRQTHRFQRLRCTRNKSAFIWKILLMDSLLKSIGKKPLSSEKYRKDMGPVRVGPEEGHKNDQRAGAPFLLR